MTTTTAGDPSLTRSPTPTDRLLTASLLAGPLLTLAADSTYAARGWDDPTAGVLHVLGAIALGLLVLRAAGWLPASSRLAAVLVLTGLTGMAGNVAYGFEAIHQSLGDTPLVDQSGAAALIKPLGLVLPLSLALVAVALGRLGRRWQAVAVLAAAVAWPVAHIADLAAVAVPADLLLVVAFGSLLWSGVATELRPPGVR